MVTIGDSVPKILIVQVINQDVEPIRRLKKRFEEKVERSPKMS